MRGSIRVAQQSAIKIRRPQAPLHSAYRYYSTTTATHPSPPAFATPGSSSASSLRSSPPSSSSSSSSSSQSSSSGSSSSSHSRRRTNIALGTSIILLGLGYTLGKTDPSTHSPSLAKESTTTLLRSYLVWTLTSFPSLVDRSPQLLDTLFHSSIPGVKPISEFVVRHTFFPQFIPGETAQECLEILEIMRRRNVGHALNYSAEVDDEDHSLGGKVKDPVVERLKEVERALDVQGDFENRMAQEGWAKGSSVFALKMVSR